jgi:tetratricopeptide (TPR) repeat protein
MAGKKMKCQKCQSVFIVPKADALANADIRTHEAAIDTAIAEGDLGRAEELAEAYRRAAGTTVRGEPGRSASFRAAYFAGQVALGAGRLERSVSLLAPLVEHVAALPDELAARLRLLLAEAQVRLGRPAETQSFLAALPDPLLRREPLLWLRALRVRLLLGELARLGADLAACDRALEARGDAANRALLACEEGRAWDRAGGLPRAAECWQKAERLAAVAPTRIDPIRADVLLQLGRLEHVRGRLGPALDRFADALACAVPGGQALEVQLRRVLVRLDLGQTDQARGEADHLLRGLDPDQLPEEVCPLAGMVRGLLSGAAPPGASDEEAAYHAAARGDWATAVALYIRAYAAEPSPERRARLALALALALLSLGHAYYGEARFWLARAEELARPRDQTEVLLRTLEVKGQMAAEQGGDDAPARRFFEEAVLLAEVQAGQIRNIVERQAYRQGRVSVVRHLLRSACRRGDSALAFAYQELERGRLLLDLLRTNPGQAGRTPLFERPKFTTAEAAIAACDRELDALGPDDAGGERRRELLRRREEERLRRDRLFDEFLTDRGRRGTPMLPALPDLEDLRRSLRAGTVYVSSSFLDDELFLLAVRREGPCAVLRAPGSARSLLQDLEGLREVLTFQTSRIDARLPVGPAERAELDGRLLALGEGPLGAALGEALRLGSNPCRRVLWVPDGPLHGIPVHALRVGGRYLIEQVEFAWTFSGALLVHQAGSRNRRWSPLRPVVVVTEDPSVLPEAQREGDGVAASFFRGRRLSAVAADRTSVSGWLSRARVAHFACHAEFDGGQPLAARLMLPSREPIYALEWLNEPIDGMELVTLSACRSAEVGPLIGREAFGLVIGLLGGGVRAVLAALWPVADAETRQLMWRFYQHRLLHGLPTALALAQREALATGLSPLFWAPFALFGDPEALPPPTVWWRWLARLRQKRHERRFPADGWGESEPRENVAPAQNDRAVPASHGRPTL